MVGAEVIEKRLFLLGLVRFTLLLMKEVYGKNMTIRAK